MSEANRLERLVGRLRAAEFEVMNMPHPTFCDPLHDWCAAVRDAIAEIERVRDTLLALARQAHNAEAKRPDCRAENNDAQG